MGLLNIDNKYILSADSNKCINIHNNSDDKLSKHFEYTCMYNEIYYHSSRYRRNVLDFE